MGNNQSNTRTKNYKKIKIIDKNERTERGENWLCSWTRDFVDFELEEYVDYRDVSSKKISFYTSLHREGTLARKFFDQVAIGDYLEIDLDMVNDKNKDDSFFFYYGVLKGAERRGADNSLMKFFDETAGFLNEITEANQRYAAAAESSRYQNQVLQSQTSYNLPPW